MTHRHMVSDPLHTHKALPDECKEIIKESYCLLLLFPDVASADQQKAAGPQQDQDEDQTDEDVAMETENQEEDLEAAEVQELKPEQLDSSKASQKGDSSSCP